MNFLNFNLKDKKYFFKLNKKILKPISFNLFEKIKL